MKGIIDRIEGDFFVVEQEDLTMVNIKRGDSDAVEGDSVIIENGEIHEILKDETKKRAKDIKNLMDELF